MDESDGKGYNGSRGFIDCRYIYVYICMHVMYAINLSYIDTVSYIGDVTK